MSKDTGMENQTSDNKDNSEKKRLLIIIAIIFLIAGALYLGYYFYGQYSAAKGENELSSLAATTQSQESKIDNPIDFKSLQAKNDEIYAWLKVNGTNIDYPVVQSTVDDDFYLKHSATDKSWLASGAVFTQSHNTKTFNDPITVVYGHNGYSDKMFTTLHKFEDSDFFNKHQYFYIYTTTKKLTYQIVSSFKYDSRHIMNSFDFQDLTDLQEFQATIKNPTSAVRNVRTDLEVPVDESSKIVVLSTCITGQKNNRYLVCGVLVKNEQTN